MFLCVAEVGPASVMVGNLVAGKRMAQASGRDLSNIDDNEQVNKTCLFSWVCERACHYCSVTGYSFSRIPVSFSVGSVAMESPDNT